ncbi:hypothetical protein ACDH70_02800 [Xanthomonas axonopodis pv. poinsettiicola]|nr:hypothetical protein [Xanthomonas codiaei]MCC8536585.1 hypothetical protein [Xanthomonas codiaei]
MFCKGRRRITPTPRKRAVSFNAMKCGEHALRGALFVDPAVLLALMWLV